MRTLMSGQGGEFGAGAPPRRRVLLFALLVACCCSSFAAAPPVLLRPVLSHALPWPVAPPFAPRQSAGADVHASATACADAWPESGQAACAAGAPRSQSWQHASGGGTAPPAALFAPPGEGAPAASAAAAALAAVALLLAGTSVGRLNNVRPDCGVLASSPKAVRRRGSRGCVAALLCALLAACCFGSAVAASPPPNPPPKPPPPNPPPPPGNFVCGAGENATLCGAFYDFYTSLGGAGWKNNSGWSSAAAGIPTSYKTFYGLTWSATIGLTAVVLTNNNLVGTIPNSTSLFIANFTSTSYSFKIGDGTSSSTNNGNSVCGLVPVSVASKCNLMVQTCSIYSYTSMSTTAPATLPTSPSLKSCSSVPGSNYTCLAIDSPTNCAVMAALYSQTNFNGGNSAPVTAAAAGFPTTPICDVPKFSTCATLNYCSSFMGAGYIKCDTSGNIVMLSAASGTLAAGASLTYQLPNNLGLLTSLTSFTISDSHLTGTLPTSIGSLTALTYLGLTTGTLTGTLPDIWSGLTGLTFISFGTQAALTGTIPTSLGSLTALKTLNLQASPGLCGAIPPALAAICKAGGSAANGCSGGGTLSGFVWQTTGQTAGWTMVPCISPPAAKILTINASRSSTRKFSMTSRVDGAK
jgi:hypothetical protein